jgi:hypothetical protein
MPLAEGGNSRRGHVTEQGGCRPDTVSLPALGGQGCRARPHHRAFPKPGPSLARRAVLVATMGKRPRSARQCGRW